MKLYATNEARQNALTRIDELKDSLWKYGDIPYSEYRELVTHLSDLQKVIRREIVRDE